ncbi:nuclease-related domain-containing DEAD/DEAH box helicase [Dasania marina]|uniref:nuclease-related domain-containing DEAD/DEAH box helicase n=1 Tax=Dasania marina TaxID=471499 RepID=UPI0003648418|nr:NERD domain-containing protein [Dasania marina]
MAKLIGSEAFLRENDHRGERSTFEWLKEALPDTITLMPSVDFLSVDIHNANLGEVDFCLIGPDGSLLLIEQKNGFITENDNGELTKVYASGQSKNPLKQILRAKANLAKLWSRSTNKNRLFIKTLVYLPDYNLNKKQPTAIDSNLVVDKARADQLPSIITELLNIAQATANETQRTLVENFLASHLQLELDIGAWQEHQQRLFIHREDQLGYFLNTMEISPYRLLIEGNAGSGKTQALLALYQQALANGERPLLICFNRPLANSLAETGEGNGLIINIDRFTDLYQKDNVCYDFSEKEIPMHELFKRLRAIALKEPVPVNWQFSTILIDEAQDFDNEQLTFIEHFLSENGRLSMATDSHQSLYGKQPSINPTVKLTLAKNYRCSKEIWDLTRFLCGIDTGDSNGLVRGKDTSALLSYADFSDMCEQLINLVNDYLNQGYTLNDIVVLSAHGINSSSLCHLDTIGPWHTHRFTGNYTDDGQQIYSEGELRVESVYRFKGDQRTVVIFTELDFKKWNDRAKNLLYTGMTRAKLELSLLFEDSTIEMLYSEINNR